MGLKKITSTVLIIGALAASSSSLLNASGLVNMNALEAMSIHGGYSSGDFDHTSVSGANVGFEMGTDFFSDKIHGAFGFDYDDLGITTATNSAKSALGTGYVTLGYKFMPNLNTYLLGGYSTIDSIGGVAYGAGIKYQLIKYVALDARYKHASLSPSIGSNVNVNVATVDIEFNFLTAK